MTIHLCFHGIGVCTHEREPGEAKYWIARTSFLGILDVVAERGGIELSFDDGNRSDIEIALPALLERGLRATFFPLAGRLDDPASINASDLKAIAVAGMTIGSHGWAHVPWRGLSAPDRRRELLDAKMLLSEMSDRTIDDAALPLGRYDRTLLGHLRAAGYRRVYTSDRYRPRRSAWLQARFSVTAHDTPDTVHALIAQPKLLAESRNRLTSLVKRIR